VTFGFVAFILCRAFLIAEVLWNTSDIGGWLDDTDLLVWNASCYLAVIDVLGCSINNAISISRTFMAFAGIVNTHSIFNIARVKGTIDSVAAILLFTSTDISTFGVDACNSFASVSRDAGLALRRSAFSQIINWLRFA
jgi:hypothetical protein